MLARHFDQGVARDHSQTRYKFEHVKLFVLVNCEDKDKKQNETHLQQHVQHLADSSHPLLHRSLILAHDLVFFYFEV